MDLVCETGPDMRVVRVDAPRIDAAVAILFKERMRELLADAPPRVVLDFGRVEFLDSSGLGAVVAVMKLAGPDRRLELAALGETVAKVFRLTRMDRVFIIHDVAPAPLPETPLPAAPAGPVNGG